MTVRCHAHSLRNNSPLQGDYRDVRAALDLASVPEFAGAEFTQHFSMNCGFDRCFAPNVTAADLMIGRVCADKRPGRSGLPDAGVSLNEHYG